MKTKKQVLVAFAAILLVLSAFNFNSSKAGETTVKLNSQNCREFDKMIFEYMTRHGYVVLSINYERGCRKAFVTTTGQYLTVVYLSDCCILGHEDINY